MSHNGKLTPNIDERTTKVLNLTVLQRLDPFIEEILITAAHVTFYEFNVDSSHWSRKDVEGSLFVVKRNTQPRFQFIVMNRRNTDNLVENLLGDFEYEVQLPYLLYRNASQEVNGIWFYNARECEVVANLFSRILGAYSKVPTKQKESSPKSDFEELEAVPSLSVIDGPLEPPLPTNTNNSDVSDDPAFSNFFSNAMNIGGTPKAAPASPAQPYHSTGKVVSTSLPRLPRRVSVSTLPALQIPTSNLLTAKAIMSAIEPPEPNAKHSTDLVTPSFFCPSPSSSQLVMPPMSPSIPAAPPLSSPAPIQRPYGTPLLQPFPPPTPPASLTPAPLPSPRYGQPVLNREKIREALQLLVQDNQFIDMVYRALMNAHQS